MKLNTALFALAFSLVAQQGFAADVLNPTPSGASFQGVALDKGAATSIEGRSEELTTVGHGLRSKKVAIINVKVYVAQLMVSDASKFDRTDAGSLSSVASMKAAAIRLDFVRSVDADTIRSAFADSLNANNLDENTPPVKDLLDAVAAGGEATDGKAMTFVGEKISDTEDAVTFESASGFTKTIHGPSGFMKNLFSIWLGKASDDGVANLKKQILSGN